MTGRKHDDDYAETQVLPRKDDAEAHDIEPTVVLGEEYRRRVEQSHNPEDDRDS